MYRGLKANFNRAGPEDLDVHQPGESPNIQMLQIAPADIPIQPQQRQC